MEDRHWDEDSLLTSLFPSIATQLRGLLSGLYIAATALAPAEAREKNQDLDRRAAQLDQCYYQILRLVTSLNAAARLDSSIPLPMQERDLVELTQKICDEAEHLASLLQLTLVFEHTGPQLIQPVHPESIRQLLFHLLSNAFKFTPPGGRITVSLQRHGGQVLLAVADTGCGMDDLRLKTLFDRYAHKELMDPPPHGLGLGLPLCRRIAQDHGGVLLAESKPGVGSRFTVRFPSRQGNGPTSPVAEPRADYTGGFNATLLGLADALPSEAFTIRNR